MQNKLNDNKVTPFYEFVKPYQDIIFISKNVFNEKEYIFNKNFNLLKLNNSPYKKEGQILYNGDLFYKNNDIYILSGEGVYNDKFYQGNEFSEIDIDEIKNVNGCVSGVKISEDKVDFFTDYFGQGKFYYYNKDDITIVSNNLHLLVLTLKYLDYELANTYLLSLNDIITCQLYNNKTFILNVYLLELDKNMFFDNTLNFTQSLISKDINYYYNKKLTNVEYRSLLSLTKDDIIANLNAILNSNKFNHYVCDLTGGMDTRLVFAALTNIEGAENKVKIYSYGEESEKMAAYSMMKVFGYKYDSVFYHSDWWNKQTEQDTTSFNFEELCDFMSSTRFCSYFDSDTFVGKMNVKLKNTVHITGGAGELSRSVMKKIMRINNSNEDINNVLDKFVGNLEVIQGSDKKTLENYKRFLYESLTNNNFKKSLSQIESSFLNYRQRYHFAVDVHSSFRTTTVMPLLSKYMFFLYLSTIDWFNFRKCFYDIVYELNPVVASFEYKNEMDNEERLKNADNLLCEKSEFKNILISKNNNLNEWVLFDKTAMSGRFNIKNEQVRDKINENMQDWSNGSFKERLYELCNQMTNYLLDFKNESEIQINAIKDYLSINNEKLKTTDFGRLIKLYRRIRAIYDLEKLKNCNKLDLTIKENPFILEYGYEDFIV